MAIYDPTKRPADSFDTHTHLNDEAFGMTSQLTGPAHVNIVSLK